MILLVLLIIVSSQILAKTGAGAENHKLFEKIAFVRINIFLAGSYVLFLCRGVLWAWVLRRHPVSQSYPFLSLAYPLVLLAGILVFGESLSMGKILGTILILGGSALMVSGRKT